MAIRKCVGCRPDPFQDERYGLGMRVQNECKAKSPGWRAWRCTICGTVHEAAPSAAKKEKTGGEGKAA